MRLGTRGSLFRTLGSRQSCLTTMESTFENGASTFGQRGLKTVCVCGCACMCMCCVCMCACVCAIKTGCSVIVYKAGSENCARLLTDPPPECRSVCCHQGARFSRGALASENWADRLRPCWFTAQVKGRRQDMHENCLRRGIVATSTRRGRTRTHTHSHVQRHACR